MTDSLPSLADAPRALPTLTAANRDFWTGGARGELLVQRCGACGRWVHPPTANGCPECGGSLHTEPVSGLGTVFSFTLNAQPYEPDVPLPFVIAIVELDEQDDLRLLTNIVDCRPEEVEIGMPVRVGFEDRGEIFVPVFTPA